MLSESTDTKCICTRCLCEFPIENIEKMELPFECMNVFSEKSIQASDIKVLELFAALELIWYQKYNENCVLFLGIENNPRKW